MSSSVFKLLKTQIEFIKSTSKVVLFCGAIASGKSFVASVKAVELVCKGGHVIVMSQSYKSLKLVLFAEIKKRLDDLGIKYVENKSDMTLVVGTGMIYGFSSDSVEALRGITADCSILDECALFDEYVYKVVQGRLRRGMIPMQTFLTTTPRGTDNWIYDVSLKEGTHFIHQKMVDNYFLKQEFLDQMLLDYDGDHQLMRQELEASFEDFADDNVIIHPTTIREARNRKAYQEKDPNAQRIAGLDLARYGKDYNAFVLRHGDEVLHFEKWNGIGAVENEKRIAALVVAHDVEVLVVDGAGLGGPIVDHLKQQLDGICYVVDYNGAYRAVVKSDRYANARAESWFLMKNWLEYGSIPDSNEFNDMSVLTYRLNDKNKIVLKSKDSLRAENKSSPDMGDALSLTFSQKVRPKKITSKPRPKRNRKFIG